MTNCYLKIKNGCVGLACYYLLWPSPIIIMEDTKYAHIFNRKLSILLLLLYIIIIIINTSDKLITKEDEVL